MFARKIIDEIDKFYNSDYISFQEESLNGNNIPNIITDNNKMCELLNYAKKKFNGDIVVIKNGLCSW